MKTISFKVFALSCAFTLFGFLPQAELKAQIRTTGLAQSNEKLLICNTVERLKYGFVLASQDEYALDVPEKEVLIAEYQNWLAGQGEELMNKFQKGEEFNDAEKPYWRLTKASYIWKAQRMYERFEQGDETLTKDEMKANEFAVLLWKEGKNLLRKGYLGERFSNEEIERLWEYRVICEIRICCPTPYRSFDIGLHRFGEEKGAAFIGEEVESISWMKMEAAMESPFYTDVPTHDLYSVIKPDAVDEFFRYFRGYQKAIAPDGREYAKEIFPQTVPGDDRFVRISDFQGKKPVVLFITSSMDSFWDKAIMEAEGIYRAYHGQVEVFWVNISIWDFLIRSYATYNYYKPNVGIELPGHEVNHEDRARTAKKMYMTFPQMTLPCVLDQNSEQTANYFKSYGGGGETVIIDIDGKIAWTSISLGWGHWYENRPPGRNIEIGWGTVVEKEIRKLLDNDGKFDPNHEIFDKQPAKSKSSRPEGVKSMYMMNGPITDIDSENRTITVKARTSTFTVIYRAPDSFQQFNPLQSFKIEVANDCKLTYDNAPIEFDKLKVGSIVIGPEIWKMPEGNWLAKSIRLIPTKESRSDLPAKIFAGDSYLFGKIKVVNIEENTITVQRDKMDINEMKGYKYIIEGGDNVELLANAKDNFELAEKWVEKDQSPIPYLFDMEGALLIRNGEYVSLSELKAGDFVSIKYAAEDEDKDKLRCAVARASRID